MQLVNILIEYIKLRNLGTIEKGRRKAYLCVCNKTKQNKRTVVASPVCLSSVDWNNYAFKHRLKCKYVKQRIVKSCLKVILL